MSILSRARAVAAPALILVLTALVGLSLAAVPAGAAGARLRVARSSTKPLLRPVAIRLTNRRWAGPPTTAQCEADLKIACYRPAQLQRAYNLTALHAKGLTGRGSTIVIVDSFGSPTAAADLHRFDKDFGLPDPHLKIIAPSGRVPAFDKTDPEMAGWAEETSLDLQWAHVTAPGADLLLVETPVAETQGLHGIPEIVHAENYVVHHRLGDVISQSFGATENTFPSKRSLLGQRSAFVNAARHHVSVLAASGDSGATSYRLDGDFYTHRVNSWPSSDPLVTSVGGTQLHLDAAGRRTRPDNVWNDTALLGGPAAGGGGHSHVFRRPSYQHSVASVVGSYRGTPDLSMSAAVDGAVLVRIGFTGGDGSTPGYYVFGGTSAATPEFAGVVAIARQAAHHPLGQLNPRLYDLARRHAPGLPDITRGNNTVAFTQHGHAYSVPGYDAAPGYDMASGLGTVDAAALVAQLAG